MPSSTQPTSRLLVINYSVTWPSANPALSKLHSHTLVLNSNFTLISPNLPPPHATFSLQRTTPILSNAFNTFEMENWLEGHRQANSQNRHTTRQVQQTQNLPFRGRSNENVQYQVWHLGESQDRQTTQTHFQHQEPPEEGLVRARRTYHHPQCNRRARSDKRR
jgi:hypothetical protein